MVPAQRGGTQLGSWAAIKRQSDFRKLQGGVGTAVEAPHKSVMAIPATAKAP